MIGWIVTNEVSILNSRRQHTINIVIEFMHNPQRVKDKEVIREFLPNSSAKLTPQIAPFDQDAHRFIAAIDRELNFFEFIAAGIATGDLDPNLTRRCLRSIILNLVAQTKDYIDFWQARSPSTWEHLMRYADRLSRPGH
jgi:hypothetical protein